MPAFKDITGERFGRLIVLEVFRRGKQTKWWVQCDCGVKKTVLGSSLRAGVSRSCGCQRTELFRQRVTTHGDSWKDRRSPEYKAWVNMRGNCHPRFKHHAIYADKGIVVCEAWHDYETFLDDVGKRPGNNYRLLRKDTAVGYQPDNCAWVKNTGRTRGKKK